MTSNSIIMILWIPLLHKTKDVNRIVQCTNISRVSLFSQVAYGSITHELENHENSTYSISIAFSVGHSNKKQS